MLRTRTGLALAWVGVMVMSFLAPFPAGADMILSGGTPGSARATSGDALDAAAPADAVPQAVAPAETARVGYALTNEEFIGGVICVALAIGTTIYIGTHQYRD